MLSGVMMPGMPFRCCDRLASKIRELVAGSSSEQRVPPCFPCAVSFGGHPPDNPHLCRPSNKPGK
ncbi:hypothetical protein ACNKHX_13660 [Shigella flexneri]